MSSIRESHMIADNHTFSSIENRVIMLDDSSQRTDEDNSGESHFIIILRLLQRNCKRLYLHILINCYLVFNQKKFTNILNSIDLE